jgi:hypothetical protein
LGRKFARCCLPKISITLIVNRAILRFICKILQDSQFNYGVTGNFKFGPKFLQDEYQTLRIFLQDRRILFVFYVGERSDIKFLQDIVKGKRKKTQFNCFLIPVW